MKVNNFINRVIDTITTDAIKLNDAPKVRQN